VRQSFQQALGQWAETLNGRTIFEQEQSLLNHAIENLFGYFCVQLGAPTHQNLMSASRIQYKLLVSAELADGQSNIDLHSHFVQADLDYLPIGREVVDVVLLPHALEIAADPYYLLRQVDAMLRPEGHMVITGFNPLGCLVMRLRFFKKEQVFQQAQLESLKRVKVWLEVLGYDIELQQHSAVTCFAQRESKTRGIAILEWFEKLLSRLGFQFGNVYCLVAKKRVDSPTLVGSKWHMPRWRARSNNGTISVARNNRVKSKS